MFVLKHREWEEFCRTFDKLSLSFFFISSLEAVARPVMGPISVQQRTLIPGQISREGLGRTLGFPMPCLAGPCSLIFYSASGTVFLLSSGSL